MPVDRAMLHTVSVLMFKLEGQVIRRNPDFAMEDRLLLHRISRDRHCIEMDGQNWTVRDLPLPTVGAEDAYTLTEEEQDLLAGFHHAFRHSLWLVSPRHFSREDANPWFPILRSYLRSSRNPPGGQMTCVFLRSVSISSVR